jgi:hypothetical protein
MASSHSKIFPAVAVAFCILPAVAQENESPEKMHERLHRYAIEVIAKAQVIEFKCDLKGQIAATISNMGHRGLVVEDFTDITYVAADIAKAASARGEKDWCRENAGPFREMVSKH